MIWCRHYDTNIIGIKTWDDKLGKEKHTLPWLLKQELQRFKEITLHSNIVVGRKTYESLPNKNLENRRIFILTKDTNFKVENKEYHIVVNDINYFKEFDDNLYISGGSEIYSLFLKHNELKPTKIFDSVYHGKIDYSKYNANVKFIDIHESVDIVKKDYIVKNKKFYNIENVEILEWKINK